MTFNFAPTLGVYRQPSVSRFTLPALDFYVHRAAGRNQGRSHDATPRAAMVIVAPGWETWPAGNSRLCISRSHGRGLKMNWLKEYLFASETKLSQLAERLAASCQEQVWLRVSERALAMPPAEARGYTKARAALVVKNVVDSAILQSNRFAGRREELRDLTTEHVVRIIGAQLRAVRPTLRQRRAA